MGKAIYSMQVMPHTKVSIFIEKKSGFEVLKFYFLLRIRHLFCLRFCLLSMCGNGRQYDKCGIRLHCIFKPAQMYVKIPNVSTNTHTRICYIVCCSAFSIL